MSARQKSTTAKKRKRKEAETPVEGPPETPSGPPVSYEAATVLNADGQRFEILAPRLEGRDPDQHNQDAKSFAKILLRLQEWTPFITPALIENRVQLIAALAAETITTELVRVALDRFPVDEIVEKLAPPEHWEAFRERCIERQRAFMLETLKQRDPDDLVRKIEQTAMASLMVEVRDEDDGHVPRRSFMEAHEKRYFEHVFAATELLAKHIARLHLEAVKPEAATLDELAELLLPSPGTRTTLAIATNAVALELTRGLLQDATKTYEATVNVRENNKTKSLKVRTRLNLNPLRASNRDDVLESMYRRLRDIKRDGAAALKLHLDLMDQAWKAGGDLPVFRYMFSEALERQGYERHEGRRAFHDETTRDIRERLALLRSYTVQSWTERKGTLEEIVDTPYWIVHGFIRYNRQEPLGFDLDDDVYPVVMRHDGAPTYQGVYIQPGYWWKLTDMSRARLDLPAGILGLSTHHERERMALLLATFLAIHVRRNHQKHAGKRVTIKVGTLLEQANVTTRKEFMSEHSELAKRRREYLDDLEDGGALATIRRLEAFDIRIEDEAEYQAAGRGWRERFWEARLSVAVPVLDIDRSLPKG